LLFNDDGTYTGDGEGFRCRGYGRRVLEQSTTKVKFRVSGNATETSEEQALHLELEYSGADDLRLLRRDAPMNPTAATLVFTKISGDQR